VPWDQTFHFVGFFQKNYRAIETTTTSASVPKQNLLFLSKRRTQVEGIWKKKAWKE